MDVDVIGAIVTYLSGALLPTVQNVYADYAPSVALPYALVHDGPESYDFSSANDGSNQPTEMVTADGIVQVEFVAETKAQARALARLLVRILVDTITQINCADGSTLELRPMRAESVPMTDVGAGTPTAFKRFVAVHYKQQFLSPGTTGG